MMGEEERAFWLACEKSPPSDPGPLLMFADWITERAGNTDVVAALVWMAERRKRPEKIKGLSLRWHWSNENLYLGQVEEQHLLGRNLHDLLPMSPPFSYYYRGARTFREAVLDLGRAMAKLRQRQEARRGDK